MRIQDDFRDPVFSLIEDWDSGFYWRTAIFAIVIINETWHRRQNYKEEEGWDTMRFGILRVNVGGEIRDCAYQRDTGYIDFTTDCFKKKNNITLKK